MNRQTINMDISTVTGIILTGNLDQSQSQSQNQSQRQDRGLQNFRGSPLLLHVIMRLGPQVADSMINANRNIGPYEGFGLAVWPDEMQSLTGSALTGIQTGLQHCDTHYLVSVPCDRHDLPLNLVQRLASELLAQQANLAVAVTGNGAERIVYRDMCLMDTTLLENLTAFLRGGGRDIEAWHATLKVAEVQFDAFTDAP
jgi:molybdopterin-guanine dinucleotide biosynthesis protein A